MFQILIVIIFLAIIFKMLRPNSEREEPANFELNGNFFIENDNIFLFIFPLLFSKYNIQISIELDMSRVQFEERFEYKPAQSTRSVYRNNANTVFKKDLHQL